MKRNIVIITCVMLSLAAFSQNIKRPESYNYQRGLEAMQEEKVDEALEYFNNSFLSLSTNGCNSL